MDATAVHGTSAGIARTILQTGFIPGPAVHNYLGQGVYASHVCKDLRRDAQVAFDNASAFAKAKYGLDTGCLWLQVSVQNALHLQDQQIRNAYIPFRALVHDRLIDLGVVFEARRASFRPLDHVAVEMFRLSLELLSGRPLDVLSAEFRPAEAPDESVPQIVAPELCIKRCRAIIRVAEACSHADIPASEDRPEDWPIHDVTRAAADQATRFIREMEIHNFFDLFCKTIEGGLATWESERGRFDGDSIALIVRTARSVQWQRLLAAWNSAGFANQRFEILETTNLATSPGPTSNREVNNIIARSAGFVFLAARWDPDLFEMALSVKNLGRPLLIFADRSIALPSGLRSTRNVIRVNLGAVLRDPRALSELLKGFGRDRWKEAKERHTVRIAIAARSFANSDGDADRIIAAYSNRHPNQLLPGLASPPDRDVLLNLPEHPEDAAEQLRRRLNITSRAIDMKSMERTVDEVYNLDIGAAGYFIPRGILGPERFVVLRKHDRLSRRRFTFAHEIGHAIRQRMAKLDSRIEEKWCDDFATSLLMPRSILATFDCSLSGWLHLADEFQVSAEMVTYRAWECSRKLLIFSEHAKPADKYPRPNVASALFEIATALTVAPEQLSPRDERGVLPSGEPFIIRKWPNETFIAAADCMT